jgi:hypothetical protein
LAKQKKIDPNSLANQLGKNRNLAKLTSPCVYICARGSWLPSVFRWEGEKINKMIPDVIFQKVEVHEQNFVSLRIPDVN